MKTLFRKIEAIGQPDPLPESSHIPTVPEFETHDPVKHEIYCHRKHVGVNLGCLFCLEGWLAPPLLKPKNMKGNWQSESDFLAANGSREHARELLEEHWRTFVTEKDFEFLASVGINAVRLPIGYWIAADRDDLAGPFKKYQGVYDAAWNYVLITIANAAKYDIGVLIDLHGAPGGQNADIHCGVSTGQAHLFRLVSRNQSLALQILGKIAAAVAPINNVIGLQVLNEPQDDAALPGFYLEAVRVIQEAAPNIRLPVYIGDAWNMDKYSEFIAQHQSKLHFCVLDTHQYFCHTPADHAKTAEQHTKHLTTGLKDRLKSNSDRLRGNMIVGEWSVVLNNQSIPSGRHDGDVMREFGRAELRVWDETCAGQFYWTYKTADDGWYWSFLYCHKHKVLPPQFFGGRIQADVSALQSKKDNIAKGLREQHKNYWSQQPNCQAVVDNAWRFEQGFEAGYEVGLRFIENNSRVGFVGQLAQEYTVQYCNKAQNDKEQACEHSWQFEQGFRQAIEALDNILRQTGALKSY